MADNMIYTGVSNSPINPVMDKVYKSPMDNIRFGAEDANVAKYVAYGNRANKKLYFDSSCTEEAVLSKADAEYAFQRGMLIICCLGNYLIPLAMTDSGFFTVDPSLPEAPLTKWTISDT